VTGLDGDEERELALRRVKCSEGLRLKVLRSLSLSRSREIRLVNELRALRGLSGRPGGLVRTVFVVVVLAMRLRWEKLSWSELVGGRDRTGDLDVGDDGMLDGALSCVLLVLVLGQVLTVLTVLLLAVVSLSSLLSLSLPAVVVLLPFVLLLEPPLKRPDKKGAAACMEKGQGRGLLSHLAYDSRSGSGTSWPG